MNSTKNSIKIVCKHCGNIFDKPYWQLKQAIEKDMEVGFCCRNCYKKYRSNKSWEKVKNLDEKLTKKFIEKYHWWIVKMIKEKYGRYNEDIYCNVLYELPRAIVKFEENKYNQKQILTYIAKIVLTKTIEKKKENKIYLSDKIEVLKMEKIC